MDGERDEPIAAMEWLLDRFEGDDDVAYAEVGALSQTKTDLVLTENGPRDELSFDETGVWCRVFADGAADYRYTTSLDEETLADVADRAVRGGEFLAQDDSARYDRLTTHQAVHGGWASGRIDDVALETKRSTLESCLAAVADAVERCWINYDDAHIDSTAATTTGSTVRTTLDRANVTVTLSIRDGPTVRRHAGSTRGAVFLEELADVFADAAADVRTLANAETAAAPTGETTVALTPRAAGQLFAFAARYLEADTHYMGLSPYDVGDEFGPDSLSVADTVHAGSWAARAYDAELRPTTPVQLIEGGTVTRLLHNTASAAEDDAFPAGHAVHSLGFDQPPRIHARHLDVAPGDANRATLRAGADVLVERFDDPWLRDEFERVQRSGVMPASALYAKDIDRKTEDRTACGQATFPIAEGYRLRDGERDGRVAGVSLAYGPETLRSITAIGAVRGTLTGVDEKHKSRVPYAVTAPGVRLRATLQKE
ncbi:Zn-dependent protease [Halogeometricum borinquense]|uniref:Zn-dependent protease n=1 Tax=Halogeometricum borinquense TaxID=60847 RepID=A0A482TG05_9EURY|nr:metallopeptidase TldD-related protein [Halogeometricum borinquense]RYJ14168.1 Zn-dependent protease [Halogeometricum borinquense]